MSFENKVAIVTGGGSGIGAQTAQLLASRGARVVVADMAEDNGREVVEAIRSSNGQAEYIKTEVTNEDQVNRMVQFAVDTYGQLDLAHNNVGIIHLPAPLHELELDVWEKLYNINVRSIILSLRAELRYFTENKRSGAIVNANSASGFLASPGIAAYTMTKHAVTGLTRAAGIEYGKQGIRVNGVAPGTVETPFSKTAGYTQEQLDQASTLTFGRIAQPEEIAETVAFLLSDAAGYVNGTTLHVDGGTTAEV